MIQPSERMTTLSSSVFAEMAEKKQAKLNAGENIIDLSIGSPDLPPPTFVRDIMAEGVKKKISTAMPFRGPLNFNRL